MVNIIHNIIKNIVFGAVIGVANIIPGVSGGTMAVVLNIYDKLISSISDFRKDIIGNIKFLGLIGVGAGLGILAFSKVIKSLLTTHPLELNCLFIGLIIGSIPLMVKKIGKKDKKIKGNIVAFSIGFILMLIITYVNSNIGKGGNEVETTISLILFIKLFVHSIIASAAMILPGVSGSLMLVILGSYFTILTAISSINIMILIPVALGCIVGILGGSKLIALALKKKESITFSVILGLVIGSVFTLVLNIKIPDSVGTIIGMGVSLIIGTLISYSFDKNSR